MGSQHADLRVAVVDGVVTRQVGDEVVVVDPRTGLAHALDPLCGRVLEAAQRDGHLDAIVATIVVAQGVTPDEAEDLTVVALAELQQAGLVRTTSRAAAEISRRALVRRATLSAAGVVALPAISTILTPSVAAAQSGGGGGGGPLDTITASWSALITLSGFSAPAVYASASVNVGFSGGVSNVFGLTGGSFSASPAGPFDLSLPTSVFTMSGVTITWDNSDTSTANVVLTITNGPGPAEPAALDVTITAGRFQATFLNSYPSNAQGTFRAFGGPPSDPLSGQADGFEDITLGG